MGNSKSGRWKSSYIRRKTVEESLRLSIQDFHKLFANIARIESSYSWSVTNVHWSRGEETIGKVQLIVSRRLDEIHVQLLYLTTGQSERNNLVNYPIGTQYTVTHWLSRRYWWTCPNCGRRCGVLYLSHGDVRFLCRTCSNLTYRKCQESHKNEKLYKWMSADLTEQMPWMTPKFVRVMFDNQIQQDLFAESFKCNQPTRKQKQKLYRQLFPDMKRVFLATEHLETVEYEKQQRYEGYLDPNELCIQSGLTSEELESLNLIRLLVPDFSGKYRHKQAVWAKKLAYLLRENWSLSQIKTWTKERWRIGNPRAWPPEKILTEQIDMEH